MSKFETHMSKSSYADKNYTAVTQTTSRCKNRHFAFSSALLRKKRSKMPIVASKSCPCECSFRSSLRRYASKLQNRSILATRGGVEDTRLEAKDINASVLQKKGLQKFFSGDLKNKGL